MPRPGPTPQALEYLALTPHQLAQVLRGFRTARGLTQREAAARGGLLQKTISSLETAPEKSSIEILYRLLTALEVELVVREKPTARKAPAKAG
jgi:HTH-type transcriptional regulator/antitoxin HipB